MDWIKVQGGAERPQEEDFTSSKVYVYLRRNIILVKGDGEEIIDHYEWEELKIKQDEYDLYRRNDKLNSRIEYVAMMSDIDLPEE